MDPAFGLWAVLFSFCALQGLFLSGVLFFLRKGRPTANRFLAILALLIAMITGGYVVSTSGLASTYPYLAFLMGPFWLLLGPALFGYMWLLTGHTIRLSWTTVLQLVPFLIYFVPTYHSVFFPAHFQAAGYGQYIYLPPDGSMKLLPLLYTYLFTGQMLTYAVSSIRLLRRYEVAYNENTADDKAGHLVWLRRLVTVFVGYMVYETVFSVLLLINQAVELHYYYISALLISTFLLVIIYTALRDPHVFQPLALKPQKYDRSSLSESYVEKNLANLLALMEEQQPFLQSDLKLPDLADMLGISRHHVSQLLNQEVGKTFHAFVNTYRVEEACRRLSDPNYQGYSLLAIAHDVGFNSKTTFNRIFKQHTRMTPSQFARKHAA